jgi:hypothetical protein
MGSITRSFANNITTSGVLLPASLVNNSIANVTAYNAAIATGNMVLLSTQTASDSASISFTTGIDSTYKEYQFYFIDIHPRTQRGIFGFNLSTDAGSNYNVTKTTTAFIAYQNEGGTDTALSYDTNADLAQSTSDQRLTQPISNVSDSSASGSMSLFNPSSTTYVKHFIGSSNSMVITSDFTEYYCMVHYTAGYGNTTSAINAVRFQMSSGNFDGTILLYGIV